MTEQRTAPAPSPTPGPGQQRGSTPAYVGARGLSPPPAGQNLADILERVLDKGVVIVGDIQVRLLDIELLTIKVRLLVASVDRAREMGINWWEGDPFVSTIGPASDDGAPQQVSQKDGSHGPGRADGSGSGDR